jgi:putative hemolysin
MNNILKICLLIASTLLLNACEPKSIEQAAPVKENLAADKVGLANPASTYCIAQGGSLDIQTEDAGQVGYCTLPDGQRIEEWQLYRNSKHPPQPHITAPIGKPNPAAEYCRSLNGIVNLADGLCTLPNGDAIDQWQLYKRDHQQAVDANEMQKIPNPAARYCLEIGGTSDFADGSCTLPSGEKVDQWALFHQHKLISI